MPPTPDTPIWYYLFKKNTLFQDLLGVLRTWFTMLTGYLHAKKKTLWTQSHRQAKAISELTVGKLTELKIL